MAVTSNDIRTIIIAANTQIEVEKLTDENTFQDLGADSLDVMTILLGVQEEYGVNIPDDLVDELNNIASITSYINKNIS